jgi:hypothetical protein
MQYMESVMALDCLEMQAHLHTYATIVLPMRHGQTPVVFPRPCTPDTRNAQHASHPCLWCSCFPYT